MNTEKFKTALDVFLYSMRSLIPTTLGGNWPADFKVSLQPGQRKSWEKSVEEGKVEKDLIDFGNLEGFAKAQPTFWKPFWGNDQDALQAALKALRVARNEVAHNTSAVTQSMVADAFATMQTFLDRIGNKDAAAQIQNLKDAWHQSNMEEKSRMKLTWSKHVTLQTAVLFMRISYDERREDMQQFLQAPLPRSRQFEGSMAAMIAERVEKHFQGLGLLDDAGQLTAAGKTVAQSGMHAVTEMGKYRIWFCHDDALLGHRILYLERERADIEANGKARHEHLPFQMKQPQYWLSHAKATEGRAIKLESVGNEGVTETLIEHGKATSRLSLRWEWDGSDRAVLLLEQGGTDRGKDSVNFIQQEIKLPFELGKWLGILFPKWNFVEQRLPVAFDDKLSEESRQSFMKQGTFSVNGFDSVEGRNIPLMPSSLRDAEMWRNWLVEKGLEKDYVTLSGFEEIVTNTNFKSAFSSFSLDQPTVPAFLATQFHGRGAATRGAAFWHLAAGKDLHP